MTEWLKLMLEEIARQQAERDLGLAEAKRRAEELDAVTPDKPAAQRRPAKPGRSSDP
jgi:hypothetical protein